MFSVGVPTIAEKRKRKYVSLAEDASESENESEEKEKKRKVAYESYDSLEDYTDSETAEEYNSGDDYMPTKKAAAALKKKGAPQRQKKAPKVKAPPEPPSKAHVSVLAEPEAAASQSCELFYFATVFAGN